ncbi:MAG TPA: AAA family ATPase [Thermoanaerobaculia bacterium]|nr:AAA family ATPase [Thermoanaerobaculia bacterium]
MKIRNVRGFKELDLDFTRPDGSLAGWTVLAGRNGAGKSSMLRLLALTVYGTVTTAQLHGNIGGWLREGSRKGSTSVSLALDGSEVTGTESQSTVDWNVEWLGENFDGSRFAYDKEHPSNEVLRQRERYFLAGYGPYRRLIGSAEGAQSLMASAGPVARVVTLFREDASLFESVTWLREIYLRRLEKGRPWLKLENAVSALLNDGLLPDGAQVEKIDSEALWINQHGVRLPLTELSDGYRTTAALVMDMIRNLYQCFGELRVQKAKDEEGNYLRVLHEGVVLIDEVDLHLHLRWQQRIGFWLKRHFPKIQFIVASHSPFVCQAADPKGLIRLPAPGEDRRVEHVSEDLYNTVVNGRVDEVVLTDLFGLETPYSAQAEQLRERVAALEARLQRGKATKAEEEELDQLQARLPQAATTAVEQVLRRLMSNV